MSTVRDDNLAHPEVAAELQAAIAAWREMSADMEEHVVEVFLARVQQRIDAQVAQQIVESRASRPAKAERRESPPWVMGGTLAIAIPLMGVAGAFAGGAGVFMVMVGVVLINTLYFIDRWVRFNLK